ncbi:hypothetical protein BU225_20115, partial [Stenotrophomonas sp. MB339]
MRERGADGYLRLREVAVPILRPALAGDLPRVAAMCQTLVQLIASADDLNLLHRGGANRLPWAQHQPRAFPDAGVAFAPACQCPLLSVGHGAVPRPPRPDAGPPLRTAAPLPVP